jgi:hypothetical protein
MRLARRERLGLRGRSPLPAVFALLLLGCPPGPNADVNGDGRIDILDVSLVASCVGVELDAFPQCVAADTDGNGVVDQADLDFVVARFRAPSFPPLASSDPAPGSAQVPRTAWLRLEFLAPVPPRALATVLLECAGSALPASAHPLSTAGVMVNPAADLPPASACTLSWAGPLGREALTFQTAAAGLPA